MIAAAPLISSPTDALKCAIGIAGGQAALARLRNVAQPTVWYWLHKLGQVPAEHVLGVESDTGIPKEDLRPDLYPRDAAAALPRDGVARDGAGGPSTPARAEPADTPESLSGLSA